MNSKKKKTESSKMSKLSTSKKSNKNLSKKTTKDSTKKITKKPIKKTTKDSKETLNLTISEQDVIELSSKIIEDMNKKMNSLEEVKKNLEQKVRELDTKISRQSFNSNEKSEMLPLLSSTQQAKEIITHLMSYKNNLCSTDLSVLSSCEEKISNLIGRIKKIENIENVNRKVSSNGSIKNISKRNSEKKAAQQIYKELLAQILRVHISTLENRNMKKVPSKHISNYSLKDILLPIEKRISNCLEISEKIKRVNVKSSREITKIINTKLKKTTIKLPAQISLLERKNLDDIIQSTFIDSYLEETDNEIAQIITKLNDLSNVKELKDLKNLDNTKEINDEIIKFKEKELALKNESSELYKKIKATYTKKYITLVLETIDKKQKEIKSSISNLAVQNDDEYSHLKELLSSQREDIESHIKEFNTMQEKELVSNKFKNRKIRDLKKLEQKNSQLYRTKTDMIAKNYNATYSQLELKITDLKQNLHQLHSLTTHLVHKKDAQKVQKDIHMRIKKIALLEKKEHSIVENQLHDLAKKFEKEVSGIIATIKTLSSKEDIHSIRLSVNQKLKTLSSSVEVTEKEVVKESLKLHKQIEVEHNKVEKITSMLQQEITSLEKKVLQEYVTKNEIKKIENFFSHKFNDLQQLQDSSNQLIEDELTTLSQQTFANQKNLHALSSKLTKDEEMIGTEMLTIANGLKKSIQNTKKCVNSHITLAQESMNQQISALLHSEKEEEEKVKNLNRTLNKKLDKKLNEHLRATYSKEELDAAFTDVASEVERVKLYEGTIKDNEKKQQQEITHLKDRAKHIEEQTSIEYLKKELLLTLEEEIKTIKDKQQQEIEEIVTLHTQEARLDKAEHYMQEKEEELFKQIQTQMKELDNAKSHWEEFFTTISKEVETDGESLQKAISSTELLKVDVKKVQKGLQELQDSQAPLKEYLVEKYNEIVESYYAMKQENINHQKELDVKQDEKVAHYVHSYAQKIMEYEKRLKDAQEVISEYVDLKTSGVYTEFEKTVEEMKKKVNAYVNEYEEEKKIFGNLIKTYTQEIDAKVKLVEGIDANFKGVVEKVTNRADEYFDTKIDEVMAKCDDCFLEKKNDFMDKERQVLSDFQLKTQNLQKHLDLRLDSLDKKFVNKNIAVVKQLHEEERKKTDSVITQLKEIREEAYNKEKQLSNAMLDIFSEFENKKSIMQEDIAQITNDAQSQLNSIEHTAEELRQEVLQRVEERMTQFEQHLHRSYLETDEKVVKVKEILTNEVEGLVFECKEEIKEFAKLKNELAQIKSDQEATNAELVLKREQKEQARSRTEQAMRGFSSNELTYDTAMILQLKENQKKIAQEVNRVFKDMETYMAELKADVFHLKQKQSNKNLEVNSSQMLSNLQQYEATLVEEIRNLQAEGNSITEIYSTLIKKGHPMFYVRFILEQSAT